MNVIRTNKHEVFTETINKIALNTNDDKKIIREIRYIYLSWLHFRTRLLTGSRLSVMCRHTTEEWEKKRKKVVWSNPKEYNQNQNQNENHHHHSHSLKFFQQQSESSLSWSLHQLQQKDILKNKRFYHLKNVQQIYNDCI